MMSAPAVTILIATYNGSATIAAALESALAQETKVPFEVLVVDDGSTDSTLGIITTTDIKGRGARIVCLSRNSGLPKACNLGVGLAGGDFIVRIDDDDLLMPGAIEAMRPRVTFDGYWSYCDHLIVDIHAGTRRKCNVGPPLCDGWLPRLSACGVMMERDILLELGGYRNIFWHEYDFYLRYLERVKRLPFYVAEPLYVCASRPDDPTAASTKMREGWRELADIWGEVAMQEHGFEVSA